MDKNETALHEKHKSNSKKSKEAPEFKSNRSHFVLCLFAGIIAILILAACAPTDAPKGTTEPGSEFESESESESEALLGMGAPVQNGTITVISPGSDMFVPIGETLQLTAEVYPEQQIQRELSW
ncbi:MAG: hypothetical protein WA125_14040, partial [Desulfosporosinus sp.]